MSNENKLKEELSKRTEELENLTYLELVDIIDSKKSIESEKVTTRWEMIDAILLDEGLLIESATPEEERKEPTVIDNEHALDASVDKTVSKDNKLEAKSYDDQKNPIFPSSTQQSVNQQNTSSELPKQQPVDLPNPYFPAQPTKTVRKPNGVGQAGAIINMVFALSLAIFSLVSFAFTFWVLLLIIFYFYVFINNLGYLQGKDNKIIAGVSGIFVSLIGGILVLFSDWK